MKLKFLFLSFFIIEFSWANEKLINCNDVAGVDVCADNNISIKAATNDGQFQADESIDPLIPSASLMTMAYYGRKMPQICKDYSNLNSSNIFVNTSNHYVNQHISFTSRYYQLKRSQGQSYIFDESSHQADIAKNKKNDLHREVTLRTIQNLNGQLTVMQDQVDQLKQIEAGYNSAGIAAGLERERNKKFFENYQSAMDTTNAVSELGGGSNLVGHILTKLKAIAEKAVFKQATKTFDQGVESLRLNCSGGQNHMHTPDGRMQTSFAAAALTQRHRMELEEKISSLINQRDQLLALKHKYDDLKNPGDEHVKQTDKDSSEFDKYLSSNDFDTELPCFKKQSGQSNINDCSCKKSGTCQKVQAPPLKVSAAQSVGNLGKVYQTLNQVQQKIAQSQNKLFNGEIQKLNQQDQILIDEINSIKEKLISNIDLQAKKIAGDKAELYKQKELKLIDLIFKNIEKQKNSGKLALLETFLGGQVFDGKLKNKNLKNRTLATTNIAVENEEKSSDDIEEFKTNDGHVEVLNQIDQKLSEYEYNAQDISLKSDRSLFKILSDRYQKTNLYYNRVMITNR